MDLIPYKGNEPYIFISYAHRNRDQVLPILRQMQEDGYRVWFDEGIDPGTEWDENIADHIKNCEFFIAFITREYLESQNCRDELSYARDIDKNRLIIYLEDVELPDGIKMRVNRLQAIFWHRYTNNPGAAYEKLYTAQGLEVCHTSVISRVNNRKIPRKVSFGKNFKKLFVIGVCICLVIMGSLAVYQRFSPTFYNESYAENVMNRALDAYVSAGSQYELLSDLAESALPGKEAFDDQLFLYQNAGQYTGMPSDRALNYLTRMLESGQAMPWSKKPMDENACRQLMTLSDDRSEEYALFESVLIYVMSDDYAYRHYGEDYPRLLSALLETDADIAAELYQIAVIPHLMGKYADHSAAAESFGKTFASATKQNRHLTGEDEQQSRISLTRLEGERARKQSELYRCGAFEAYKTKP